MRICVIGAGGREHALLWAIAHSGLVDELYALPGNPGMAQLAECIPIGVGDFAAIIDFLNAKTIDLVVIGPEQPLVDGLADMVRTRTKAQVFGPSRAAAQLEGSKSFMKKFVSDIGVPTAKFRNFTDYDAAIAYVENYDLPVVVKASGLAAGKGVLICETHADACDAIHRIMKDRCFGDAGHEIVIEEFLQGEELSFFALCDGKTALPFGAVQDYKRAFDGDTGPNTGGMGAFAPVALFDDALEAKIMDTIIQPVCDAMAARGTPYQGVLFAGLMITKSGPQLIEFNIRFGDPETQVLMARLQTDIVPLLQACCDQMLAHMSVRWFPHYAINVVMAAKGYPDKYRKDTQIGPLPDDEEDRLQIFHAGTKRATDGGLLANGGRVLNVVGMGDTHDIARAQAYDAISRIDWDDGFWRKDIAKPAK